MNLEILNKYIKVYKYKPIDKYLITYIFIKNYRNKYILINNNRVYINDLIDSVKSEIIGDKYVHETFLDYKIYNLINDNNEVKLILDKIIIKHKLWNYMKN